MTTKMKLQEKGGVTKIIRSKKAQQAIDAAKKRYEDAMKKYLKQPFVMVECTVENFAGLLLNHPGEAVFSMSMGDHFKIPKAQAEELESIGRVKIVK